MVLEKMMKMWKVYRPTDGRMDRQTEEGRQVIRKDHLSFQLRWAKKGRAFHLNKLTSPSPNDALCSVWLKLALWFWRRRFFHFVNVSSLFRNYLPLEKGGALHLNKLESPSPKDALCQVSLKLAQWLWRRRWKREKFMTTTTTTTDNHGHLKCYQSFAKNR